MCLVTGHVAIETQHVSWFLGHRKRSRPLLKDFLIFRRAKKGTYETLLVTDSVRFGQRTLFYAQLMYYKHFH